MSATDELVGNMVQAHLVAKGVETPMLSAPKEGAFDIIQESFRKIMEAMGLDMADDSLQDSPKRVAKMFTKEIFKGLDYKNFPKCTIMKNKMQYSAMVCEEGIAVKSYCEHHFVAIDGVATVAYIPGEHVVGLSKLNRIVDFFSRRPQVQERLTEQVYEALTVVLGTEDVAVMVKATHFCVKHRGVEDANSTTTTCKLGGKFKDEPTVRAEFLSIANAKG